MHSILVVDTVCEPGHDRFNRHIIQMLVTQFNVILYTSRGFARRLDIPGLKILTFNERRTNRLARLLWQYSLTRKMLKYYSTTSSIACFVLAYETIPYSLATFRASKPVFLFEHNNVDQLQSSTLKRYLYRAISNTTIHITLEKYIATYIRNEYGKVSRYINHPSYQLDEKPIDKCQIQGPYIFCPNGTVEPYLVKTIEEYAKINSDYEFYFKGHGSSANEKIHHVPFYNNYDSMLKHATFVLSGVRYTYRVSGIVYESLCLGKFILLQSSKYAHELAKRFPKSIYTFGNLSELTKLLQETPKSDTNNLEIREYRRRHSSEYIQKQLLSIMSEY